GLHPAGGRVDHVTEGNGLQPPANEANDRAMTACLLAAQKLHRAVAEVARVLRVEWNRVRGAQPVAKILVDERDLEIQFLEPRCQAVLDHPAELDLSQAQMLVRVPVDLAVPS